MKYEIKTPEDAVPNEWPKFAVHIATGEPFNQPTHIHTWVSLVSASAIEYNNVKDLRILPPGTTITITV